MAAPHGRTNCKDCGQKHGVGKPHSVYSATIHSGNFKCLFHHYLPSPTTTSQACPPHPLKELVDSVISLVSRMAHPCPFPSVIDAKVDIEIQLS